MADTTFLKDNLQGTIPKEIANEIIKEVVGEATSMQICKTVPMNSEGKVLPVLTGSGSAFWVNEGEKIGTTIPTFDYPTLEAKKLAVIIPVTREKLEDSVINVLAELQIAIKDSFSKAIDNAILFGVQTPFTTNILTEATKQKIVNTNNIVNDLSDSMGKVEENNLTVNNIILPTSKKKELRKASTSAQYKGDITQNSVFDTPINYPSVFKANVHALVGNFDKSIIGLRENIEYEVLKEATVNNINLAENDMAAIKCTMRIGFVVVDSKGFSAVLQA